MRQLALLGGFVLSVFIGGVSISIILFSLTSIDEGAVRMMRVHPGPFLITYLPYVWVATLIAFGFVAYYDMRNIKGAYRFRSITILSASVIVSIVVGGILHTVGAGRIAERRFAQMAPGYEGLDMRNMHFWMRPQEGMLAGRIVSGAATSTFVLEDFSGARWTVLAADAAQHGSIEAGSSSRVRVAGSLSGSATFHATDVFPWVRQDPSIDVGRGMMRDFIQGNGPTGPGMMPHERN